MIYFDTAYLAKCYLNETGADKVRAVAAESPVIGCCQIGEVELAAVFNRHLREGRMSQQDFRIALEQFRSDQAAGVWTWFAVTKALLEESAAIFQTLPPSVFLRAADALHLTCARRNGLKEVYTNDRHMLRACEALGMVGRNVL